MFSQGFDLRVDVLERLLQRGSMPNVARVSDVVHDLRSREQQPLPPRVALDLVSRARRLWAALALLGRSDLIFDGLALPSARHDLSLRHGPAKAGHYLMTSFHDSITFLCSDCAPNSSSSMLMPPGPVATAILVPVRGLTDGARTSTPRCFS